MPSARHLIIDALRQVAVGVAVIAVLMSAFGVHLHTCSGDGHVHGVHLTLGTILDDADPVSPEGRDADGCDTCHNPSSALLAPDVVAIAPACAAALIDQRQHHAGAPDSLSYPPDLPPAVLS